MKLHISLPIALVAGFLAAAAPASGQTSPVLLASSMAQSTAVRRDSLALEARLAEARRLFVEHRLGEARRTYAAVAEAQEGMGQLPEEALWQLAAVFHAERRPRRAAAALSRLAEAAELHGDPVVQARALLEAAVLFHRAGDAAPALACIRRLDPLLSSPYLPDEVRDDVRRRIIR